MKLKERYTLEELEQELDGLMEDADEMTNEHLDWALDRVGESLDGRLNLDNCGPDQLPVYLGVLTNIICRRILEGLAASAGEEIEFEPVPIILEMQKQAGIIAMRLCKDQQFMEETKLRDEELATEDTLH